LYNNLKDDIFRFGLPNVRNVSP